LIHSLLLENYVTCRSSPLFTHVTIHNYSTSHRLDGFIDISSIIPILHLLSNGNTTIFFLLHFISDLIKIENCLFVFIVITVHCRYQFIKIYNTWKLKISEKILKLEKQMTNFIRLTYQYYQKKYKCYH
jgi:hypothetical protein